MLTALKINACRDDAGIRCDDRAAARVGPHSGITRSTSAHSAHVLRLHGASIYGNDLKEEEVGVVVGRGMRVNHYAARNIDHRY